MDTVNDTENKDGTQTQEPPQKISPKDFAAKIKAKYPEYKDVEDNELVNKIVTKYPEYKEQINYDTEVKKKEESTPVPSPSLDGRLPSVAQEITDKENPLSKYGINAPKIPKEQQSNQSVSTDVAQPKITATYDDFRDHNAERKEKHAKLVGDAIDNTARKVLKNKGIIKPEEEGKPMNISQFSQFANEKERLQEDVANGDATFAISKDGEVGLKRTTGFMEGIKTSWNQAMQSNDEAAAFADMDAAKKVDFLNQKQQEAEAKPKDEYLGTRGSSTGSIGNLLGSNAPFLIKAGEGAAAGAGLIAAAPETLGASLTGLPAAMGFLFTANDAKNQGIQNEVTRRYYELKHQHPEVSDVDNMKEAENGALAGGLAGIAENALLMKGVKEPLSFANENVVKKAVKKALTSTVYASGAMSGVEGAKMAEGNLEGIKSTPGEIAKKMSETFGDNLTTLGALHVITGGVTGLFKLPKVVSSALKYSLKDIDPKQLSSTLEANEKAGTVPEGTTDKVMSDIEGYKAAVNKTTPGLSPEAEASVAGLIQAKDNLIAEQKTKDSSAKPYYDEKIAGLDEQIQKIQNTGKPYAHEIDEMSGDKYTAPKAEEEKSSIVTEPPQSFPEPTLIVENGQPEEATKENEIPIPAESQSQSEEVVNKPIGETGSGENKEPPITPEQKVANESDNLNQWTRVNRGSLSKVKDLFRKVGIGWDARKDKAMEVLQSKARQGETLVHTAVRELDKFHSELKSGKQIRFNTDDQVAMHFLKISTEQEIAKNADEMAKNSDFSEINSVGAEILNDQLDRVNSVLGNMRSESGVGLGYGTVEARLHPDYGFQVRQMQMIRANGGEPLSSEQTQFLKDQWAKEKDIMQRENELHKKGMQEDFDNQISQLRKEYEDKLKNQKTTSTTKSAKEKTLSQKGKDVADQIRKLKQTGSRVDFTLGTWNLAVEGIAKLVEAGSTVAEAIDKLLKDGAIGFKEQVDRELFENTLVDGLKKGVDRNDIIEKIKALADKNGDTDISNEMVSKGLLRDYVNSHIGDVDQKELLDKATNGLKEVLPDVTKERLSEAYLKQGDFKQESKINIENSIAEQKVELKRIAKESLTAYQQQKIKLQQEKDKAEKKIDEFQKRLDDKDFIEPSSRTPIVLRKADAELIALNVEKKQVESAYRVAQKEFKEKNQPKAEQYADTARSLWVMYLIGHPKTFAKIAWMSLVRPASEMLSKLTFGKAFNLISPTISKAALSGGESSSIASVKKMAQAYFNQKGEKGLRRMYERDEKTYKDATDAYNSYKNSENPSDKKLEELRKDMNKKMVNTLGNFMYQFIGGSSIKDAYAALVNRSNIIEQQFGNVDKEHFDKKEFMDAGGNSFLGLNQKNLNYIAGFVGRSHSAAKTFSGRASFAAGFAARLEDAINKGEDLHGNRLLEIGHESYLDWERGKYQQSNFISDVWNRTVNSISEKFAENPKWEKYSKATQALLKTDVAITRVPVNIIHEEVAEYLLGAFRAPIIALKEYDKAFKQTINEGYVKEADKGVLSDEFRSRVKEIVSSMDEKQAARIARMFRKGGLGLGLYAAALTWGGIHFGIFPHKGQPKKKDEADLKGDELNPGQIMFGKDKLGETTSGMIEHTPALWDTFMALGLAKMYGDDIAKNKTTTAAAADAITTHLKIIEGNIPQTKIISPTQTLQDMGKSIKKSGDNWGLTQPSLGEGNDFNDDTIKFVTDKKIKIPVAPKTYIKDNKEVMMPNDLYKRFVVRRSEIINDAVSQLKQKGTLNKKTDDKNIQQTVKDAVEMANERTKYEFGLTEEKKPEEKTFIKDFKMLPIIKQPQ